MSLTLDFIKERQAIEILNNYNGVNPYIKKLKLNKKIKLTDNQIKYVMNNHNKEPFKVNRVMEITEFIGEELRKSNKLPFTPRKILVQYILAETEKTYHIYGKLKQNQEKSDMYFIPKTQLLEDPYFTPIDVDVDFDKYVELDTLKRKPFEHQKEGIKFLLSRDGAILASDMGLGKTIMSVISALESGSNRILVVCPASVKINWEREINFFDDNTSIISGRKWKPNKFTIINYDILKNFHSLPVKKKSKNDEINEEVLTQIKDYNFDLVIIDEAHLLKNNKAIRTKILMDICKTIPKVWLLTGTPIQNKPIDYYNLLKIIKAPVTDNWEFFVKRYCDAKTFKTKLKNGTEKKVWLTDGNSNLDELSIKTRNQILRRLKEDVLDMPDKTIIPFFLELTNEQESQYNSLWDEYIEKRREEGKTVNIQKDLVELILLRKFIAMETIPYTTELTDNAIEEGNKVIIFTNFTDELMELHQHYKNCSVIHYGGMNEKQKQKSVDEFTNNPKIKVFIGNVKSAGVGINLIASNVTIFNSFDWVPGINEQAEDRSYRLNQKNNVTIYYMLFKDTISVKIWWTLKRKSNIINQILRDDVSKLNEEEKEILNYLKEFED